MLGEKNTDKKQAIDLDQVVLIGSQTINQPNQQLLSRSLLSGDQHRIARFGDTGQLGPDLTDRFAFADQQWQVGSPRRHNLRTT